MNQNSPKLLPPSLLSKLFISVTRNRLIKYGRFFVIFSKAVYSTVARKKIHFIIKRKIVKY